MHQFYHMTGLTDLQVMKDQAEAKLKRNEESIVHLHKFNEPCMGKCIGYAVKNEVEFIRETESK